MDAVLVAVVVVLIVDVAASVVATFFCWFTSLAGGSATFC